MTDRPASGSSGLDVGLNLLWLRPGEVGGTESYAVRVIRALQDHEPDLRLRSFCSTEAADAHRATIGATAVHAAPAAATSPVQRVAIERTWLRRQVSGLDVLHHMGGTAPRYSGPPVVVTIHDLQPLDMPSNFPAVKRMWLSMSIPAAIERADVIVTPSDWVAGKVIDRFGVLPERVITVSAYANDLVTRPIDGEQADSPTMSPTMSPTVEMLIERGPIALYPAMTMSHKNHEMLFNAFGRAARLRPELQLVCVGSIGVDHDEIVRHAHHTSRDIHVLGLVSGDELGALMQAAEVMVFPSKYEGFGLPILEAQSSGVPIIASDSTALPEVSGGAAIHIPADDIEAWADALGHQMSEAQRVDLVERGHTNTERYTPAATAAAQLRAYRTAASAT